MNLPPELSQIDVSYVRRISDNEYSSSCPKCGGVPHRSGEYPDRFRVFLHSKTYGGVLGWCRQCGYTWTPKGERIDPAKQQEWVKEREGYELERKAKAERALEMLRREQVWLRYHENLNGEVRQMYYKRGIEDYWIDYWMLGYNPDKVVWTGKEEYHSPALTIPVFEPGNEKPLNVRNRLLSPSNPGDKYRPEFGNLPSSLYFTDREAKPRNKVLVVEGEFKAMTTYLTLDDPEIFVVGTPGKTPNPKMFEWLSECEVVYLLLDPDAFVKQQAESITPIRRMIDYFKERSRVISLPYKVDDMIESRSLNKESLHTLISGSRRIQWQSVGSRN